MTARLSFTEAVYAHFYRRRKREAESRRVAFKEVKVVSVGNLTTGGTGKTPAVQWLARRLQKADVKTVVIGRGYRGKLSNVGGTVSDGKELHLNAEQAGDEAIAHAQALPGIPIVIGRDRVAAVRDAIAQFSPQLILLDDAFQYWSLQRDFDLVLLDARKPFGNGKLLPLGRLREPKEELKRASAVLLTRADALDQTQLSALQDELRQLTSAPIFLSCHRPQSFYEQGSGRPISLQELREVKGAGIAALADNEQFFVSLRALGLSLESTFGRRDHHRWREREVRDFVLKARQKDGIEVVITTEKDAVKIRPEWCAPLPLISLRTELQIAREAALWELIGQTLFGTES